MKTKQLYDLSHTLARPLLEKSEYPWEILGEIKNFILELGKTLDPEKYDMVSENVWIAKSATVFPSAYIGAPCITAKHRGQTLCLYPRKRACGKQLCGRQLHRGQKQHHL